MKTLIQSLLFALSLSLVTPAATFSEAKPIGRPTAATSYKSGIYTSINGKLNIALDKETGGTVLVRLTDAAGSTLFSRHLGKNERTFRTRLNLNNLEDGTYYVEITNGVETTRQTVTIATNQPQRMIRTNAVATN